MSQRVEKKIGKRSQAASAKRQAILMAALAVFSQYGIHGARLEQVAERAGVSKTNLLLLLSLERGVVCRGNAADP